MWAISGGHREFVRLLIEGGADVHAFHVEGLHAADVRGAQRRYRGGKAADRGRRRRERDGTDRTHVLPYAITNAQDEFALFLLEQGADPNGTIDGIPALHAAAGAVTTGSATGRDGTASAGRWRSAAASATCSFDRRFAVVKALLDKGADPNGRITTSAMIMGYIGYPKKGAFEPFATGTGDLTGATPLWVAAYAANGSGGRRPAAPGCRPMVRRAPTC